MTLVVCVAVTWRDEVVLGAVRKNELASLQPERREIDISDVQDLRHFLDARAVVDGIELQGIVVGIARNDVLHRGGSRVVQKRVLHVRRIPWNAPRSEVRDYKPRSIE